MVNAMDPFFMSFSGNGHLKWNANIVILLMFVNYFIKIQ